MARRQRARSARADRRPRRLPAREHDGRPDDPSRIVAVLDWEMGAIGDPRADVGYLLATYSEPGGPPNPLGTSPVTALAGLPVTGPSSSSATSREAGARSSRSPGSRRSRSGRRPSSARRSTAASCAASSAPRTSAPRASSRAFRYSPSGGRGDRATPAPSVDDGVEGETSPYSAISASARSASGCCVETSSDVAPDSRHASSRSASRSFGPTSATSSTNASGTAAAASRLFPSR